MKAAAEGVQDRLREANMTKSREPVDETLTRLRTVRESWAQMLRSGPNRPRDTIALEAA